MGENQTPRLRNSTGPDGTRASDAEREQTITVLQQHYVDGRITAEELSERTDHIYESRTRGALAEVLDDLPALPRPEASPATAREGTPAPRRRPPVAAIIFGVIAVMLLLRGIAWAVFGGPDSDFEAFPLPLFPLLFVWIAFRARRARS